MAIETKERSLVLHPHEVRAILEQGEALLWRVVGGKTIRQSGMLIGLTGPDTDDVRFSADDDEWYCEGGLWHKRCPFGSAGALLYGRETWRIDWTPACGHGIRYAVDEEFVCWAGYQWLVDHYGGNNHTEKWRSSSSMPRWASRLTLENTGVAPARLQSITEEEALSSGIGCFLAPYPTPADWPQNEEGKYLPSYGLAYAADRSGFAHSARDAFARVWDKLNPKHPWRTSPWVWRVAVRRVERETK
jgi:hypothetical protein